MGTYGCHISKDEKRIAVPSRNAPIYRVRFIAPIPTIPICSGPGARISASPTLDHVFPSTVHNPLTAVPTFSRRRRATPVGSRPRPMMPLRPSMHPVNAMDCGPWSPTLNPKWLRSSAQTRRPPIAGRASTDSQLTYMAKSPSHALNTRGALRLYQPDRSVQLEALMLRPQSQ
jgi:hypothetical protein